MDDSKIFDKKYNEYLPQIREFDFSEKAEILGIQKRDQLFVFEFFNRQIAFDRKDFADLSGDRVTDAVKVVLCRYLLLCPSKLSESFNRLVTFREFANAGPLFSRFSEEAFQETDCLIFGQHRPDLCRHRAPKGVEEKYALWSSPKDRFNSAKH